MVAEDLNIIQRYIDSPSSESGKNIFSSYFQSDVLEEFFWMRASIQNQSIIFDQVYAALPDYFEQKVVNLIEGKNERAPYVVLQFLNELAKGLRRDNKNFKDLYVVVDGIIDRINKSGNPDLHSLWNFGELIMQFPLKEIKDKHLRFISDKLLSLRTSLIAHSVEETLIPRILQEKDGDLLLKVISEILFKFDYDESPANLESRFDKYILSKIIKTESIKAFTEIITPDKLWPALLEIIKQAAEKKPYDFSYLWIPSIEDTDQIWDKSSFAYLVVKFVRELINLGYVENEFIKSNFLESDVPILRRFGIYAIGQNYKDLKELLWKWEYGNPLYSFELKHEIFHLLQSNASILSKADIDVLFSWIDTLEIPPIIENEPEAEKEKHRALIGKEFIAALANISEGLKPFVIDKKDELDRIHPFERDNPGFNSYHYSTFGGMDYPESEEEFEKHTTSTSALVDHLNSLESMLTPDQLNGQTVRIQNLFSVKPELISSPEKIVELNTQYLPSILIGLEKAWGEGKEIDWSSLFRLVNLVVNSRHWKTSDLELDRNRFIHYFCWLIVSANQNDNRAMDEQFLVPAKDVCLIFLKLGIHSKRVNKDPFFDILNSTEGSILEATLNILLRNARLNHSNESDKWFTDIKSLYTETLRGDNYNDAFMFTIAGRLPQFGYLDINWVEDNIDYIFPKAQLDKWKMAMRCYTKMSSKVFKDLFRIMLNHGHYDFGINTLINGDDGTFDFIKQICLSNREQWNGQKLEDHDSLINKVLLKADRNQLLSIVSFYHTDQGIMDIERLIDLWQALISVNFVSVSDKEEVYVESLKWVVKIRRIDDTLFEFLSKIVKSIRLNDRSYEMFRHLVLSKEDDIVNRAKLITMITGDNIHIYSNRDGIETMTKKLYEINPKFADDFVNVMIEKRLFGIIKIYNDYHAQVD